MANSEASQSSALVAELSLTFRDELTASIQSAFSVAVEIAVVEVSKLVGQALRDVRDQMHETLRDNKSLKSRLRATEVELRTVRGRLADARRQNRAVPAGGRIQAGGRPPAGLERDRIGPMDLERQVESALDVKQKYEQDVSGESFCEIREDGSVCTQDLKPDLTVKEGSTAAQVDVVKEIKEDHHSIQENPSHFSQVCDEADVNPGSSAGVMDGSLSCQDGHTLPEVAVKMEETEACRGPGSGSLCVQEQYSSDCLSLAQSKLLEDWRPEPLQVQSDSYPATASDTLDSSLFQVDIPELDFLTSGASNQPDAFPSPLSQRDASSNSNHVPNPVYSTHNSGPLQHACKICGQSFNLQEDLRRHRSLVHPKQPSHYHKSPKRNLFPPGRSPYHCSQCGRDFNRMEHLKIHQRIHTGERPYVCSVCSARFRHSWALTRHFRIHTGEKPYTCAQCGKTFRNCGGLRFHQRSHARGEVV